jgi:hypothetical protein
MTNTETLRNAELTDLVALLQDQQNRRLDMVVSASKISSVGGQIVVAGADQELTEDGVTDVNGVYRPTAVFDEGLADKLALPTRYLRRLRDEGRSHLLDENVNELLHGWTDPTGETQGTPDARTFLVRALRSDSTREGVARALLSDSYKPIENLDVLLAMLDGMRKAGLDADVIDKCDLTDRRMYVRVVAKEIQALAPALLRNYKSPFSGAQGADNPTVFAGFVLSNSETGGGAFTVTPRLVIEVCSNGMTMTKDALRSVHLGSKLETGRINWSAETQEANLTLIAAKARDAVTTFLNTDYMERVIREVESQADEKVTEPVDFIEKLSVKLAYGKEQAAGILDHFIRGGDTTRGGVMNAITSAAQEVGDADKAMAMEGRALEALTLKV